MRRWAVITALIVRWEIRVLAAGITTEEVTNANQTAVAPKKGTTMNTIELEEIRIQKNAIRKTLDALEKRASEIYCKDRESDRIVADETLLKDDVREDEVNYILGQSAGFVSGFGKAIETIVLALSSEYRDIPMTESELYMLIELGEISQRAELKDFKQKRVMEKSGWRFAFDNRTPVWIKDEKESNEEAETKKEA